MATRLHYAPRQCKKKRPGSFSRSVVRSVGRSYVGCQYNFKLTRAHRLTPRGAFTAQQTSACKQLAPWGELPVVASLRICTLHEPNRYLSHLGVTCHFAFLTHCFIYILQGDTACHLSQYLKTIRNRKSAKAAPLRRPPPAQHNQSPSTLCHQPTPSASSCPRFPSSSA